MHSSQHVRSLSLLSLLLLSLACLTGCGNEDSAGARKAWEDYFAAANAKDGQKAVVLVTRGSHDYYEKMRVSALEADEPQVKSMPLMDQIMVLTLRHNLEASYLRGVTGAQLYSLGVSEGWLAMDEAKGMQVHSVNVKGDTASITVEQNGKRIASTFQFVKEDGAWKLDVVDLLTKVGPVASAEFSRSAAMMNLSVDEFLLATLEEAYGKPVSPDIWKKPKP